MSSLTARRSLSSLRAKQRVVWIACTAASDRRSNTTSFLSNKRDHRFFSSTSEPPPPSPLDSNKTFRLRRPDRQPQQPQQQQQQPQQGSTPKTNPGAPSFTPAYPGSRPNALTLFPGDYGDTEYDIDVDDDVDQDGDYEEFEEDPEEIEYRERVREEHEKEQAQRERWMENAKPIDWKPVIDERGRSYGRGGRKRAQARVWIQAGMGEVVVNNSPFIEYFDRLSDREHVLEPFVATETCGRFDVEIKVKGGGLTGQAGAARLGVARALNAYNPDLYRPPLKFLGHLTRDARKVERKKIGHVKARKSPQWVRR